MSAGQHSIVYRKQYSSTTQQCIPHQAILLDKSGLGLGLGLAVCKVDAASLDSRIVVSCTEAIL